MSRIFRPHLCDQGTSPERLITQRTDKNLKCLVIVKVVKPLTVSEYLKLNRLFLKFRLFVSIIDYNGIKVFSQNFNHGPLRA